MTNHNGNRGSDMEIQTTIIKSPGLDDHTLEVWNIWSEDDKGHTDHLSVHTLLKCPVDQGSVRYKGHHQWSCICGIWQASDHTAQDHPALRYHLTDRDLEIGAEIRAIATVAERGVDKARMSAGHRVVDRAANASPKAREIFQSVHAKFYTHSTEALALRG